jgi:uncharacterized UPF0146 family protein
MLTDFCNDNFTDKKTVHSYLDAYQALFQKKKFSATQVLEVGIGPFVDNSGRVRHNGGSIKMWADFFLNAQVHACDIIHIDEVNSNIVSHPRIHLHTSNNAYNYNFITTKFLSKGITFDVLVDDGPHTLDSMKRFIALYLPLLKDDGILVIEDVQNIAWTEELRQLTPDIFKPYVKIYDRREIKGRYDDIMFVIDKTVRSV